jgi:hypothetical protein
MRHVIQPPAPSALVAADAIERLAAIAHFQSPHWPVLEADKATRFEFKAYKTTGVMAVLETAFKSLCAYCESRYEGVALSGHVEHYRPKAAVDTPTQRRRKPGYYWLASTWDNLVPVCPACNSEKERTHADGSVSVSGKGNAFPLADEGQRATAPGEEVNEVPLLLHPCKDEPDDHLTFEEELILPRDGSVRGEKTIEILGLNRVGLIDSRRDRLLPLKIALTRLKKARDRARDFPDNPIFADEVAELEDDVAELVSDSMPFPALIAHYLSLPEG